MTNIQLGYQTHLEQKQHNRATEEQAKQELGETIRHNVVYENETNRHNLMNEYLEKMRAESQVKLNSAQARFADANAELAKVNKSFTDMKQRVYAHWGDKTAQQEYNAAYSNAGIAANQKAISDVAKRVSRDTETAQKVQQYAGIIGSALGGVKTVGEGARAFGQAGKILYGE